jgi:tryptophan-rich sensory protein
MKFDVIVKLVVALAASFLAAVLGWTFTAPALPSWYAFLNKPSFGPPGWLFGPVWAVLYVLMAVAFFWVWTRPKGKERDSAIALYAAQLIMNVLWPVAFFGLRSVLLGLAIIVVLLALLLVTTYEFHKISKPAAYAMVPYVLWVAFATLLNGAIYLLNP